jgi:hypothetical protein
MAVILRANEASVSMYKAPDMNAFIAFNNAADFLDEEVHLYLDLI